METTNTKSAGASRAANYGSTDENESLDDAIEMEEGNNGQLDGYRRLSSISMSVSSIRQSITSAADHTREALHSHTMSTLALGTSVFSMIFLLASAFPYTGFMSMHLVPDLTLESAGTHAGMLSGSLMIGRAFSAWPSGVACDVYGRKFVLISSSLSSAILILAFGFSSTYEWAVAVRFLTGLFNGTMLAARVSVTELARGDRELEARGMGLVMSAIGFGMLIGPAIGGLLSEPVTQYPNVDFGVMKSMLVEYPFVLPNIAGALFCAMSTIMVALSVEETLPEENLRHPKHIVPDLLKFLGSVPRNFATMLNGFKNNEYENIETITAEECPNNGGQDEGDDVSIEEDLKILGRDFGDVGGGIAMSCRSSRASFQAALRRPSTIKRASISMGKERAANRRSTTSSHISHNITSLMQDDRIRGCISCYWMTTLASTAAGECFPLFAMASIGGLGVGVKTIGIIGAGSGLLFVVCQYFIFAASMKRLGLHKTMVSSCLLAVPPVALIPVSLLFKAQTSAVVLYLSVLNGVMFVAFSNWNAAITITQNRAVEPQYRARLNGLAAIGASVARGVGPIFAGALVTFSYTSGVAPTQLGSLIVYSIVAVMGAVAFLMNTRLEDEDDIERH